MDCGDEKMKLRNLLVLYTRQTRKHLWKGVMLTVLFTVAIVMMHLAIYQWMKSQYDILQVKQQFPDRDNLYNIKVWLYDDGEATNQGLRDFIAGLKGINGVELSGKFYLRRLVFEELMENQDFLSYNANILANTPFQDYPSEVQLLFVDREMTSILDIQELANAKCSNKVPLLVGTKYKDYFQMGDIYTDSNTGCQYQICGVIPDGLRLPSNLLFYSPEAYQATDDILLALYEKQVDPSGIFLSNASNSIYCKTDGNMETVEEIKKLAQKNFIDVDINTIDELITQYKEKNRDSLQTTALFTGMTVVSAFLAIISSSIIQIILRKQEYGILFANGVSRLESIKLIAMENGVRQGIAFLVATLYVLHRVMEYGTSMYSEAVKIFCNMVIARTFLIVFLLWVFSTCIPALFLNRMKTVELLGGNEL